MMRVLVLLSLFSFGMGFVPLLDGGKNMPEIYRGWFNDQLFKQASAAISKAMADGKKNIEVQFPPVPNVEEVRFGTPLNQRFGQKVVDPELKVKGGYCPGSNLSRNLLPYSNIYWAKKLANSIRGGIMGKPACVLTSENVNFASIGKMGDLSRSGQIFTPQAQKGGRKGEAVICVNPGGEETWKKLQAAHGSTGAPFVILNNAYSTTYDLGNKKNFEEAYFLKRISKGWVFRAYPGPWKAYLEKPDNSVELVKEYKTKPKLREVATLVREESMSRYAIYNDRYSPGLGERL